MFRLSWRAFPYLLLAPAALTGLAVGVYPVVDALRVSTTRTAGMNTTYVGMDNYRNLFHDSIFWDALRVTVTYTSASCALELVLGVGLAVAAMNARGLARTARSVLMLPMVLSPMVVGIIWRLLYASQVGPVPFLASQLGADHAAPLSDIRWALPSLIIVDVWQWTPFIFLVVLAGLQGLPEEPLEAAHVDGAGPAKVFWSVMLPMIRPIIGVALLLRVVDSFTTFDQVFVLTRGGPGTSTQLLSIYSYNTAFKFSQFGYAASMTVAGMVLLLAIVALIAIFIRHGRRARG